MMRWLSIFSLLRRVRGAAETGVTEAGVQTQAAVRSGLHAMADLDGVQRMKQRFVEVPIAVAMRLGLGLAERKALLRTVKDPFTKLPRRLAHSLRLQAAWACIHLMKTEPFMFFSGLVLIPSTLLLIVFRLGRRFAAFFFNF
jgi:hypothetical protein